MILDSAFSKISKKFSKNFIFKNFICVFRFCIFKIGFMKKYLTGFVICACGILLAQSGEAKWWRGNLHTHSLWSDGDDYPEMIARWYKESGYHFLAISDHNVFQKGMQWSEIEANAGGKSAFDRYLKTFGSDWVETKMEDGKRMVRLKPFDEYRSLFEEPARFLLIPGEEITDRHLNAPVHLNMSNLVHPIDPQGGSSVLDVMQRNVRAVLKQREETGRAMIVHLNHPNYQWAITAEELMQVSEEKFFEVYNGHPAVSDPGDAIHPSTERMWDIILTWRLGVLHTGPIYGLATDDSHNYHAFSSTLSNSGRGWIMVRASHLSPEKIIRAMEAGDFYASTGVVLSQIRFASGVLSIRIQAEKGIEYRTEFIGTRRGFDASSQPVRTRSGEKLRISHRYSDELGAILKSESGSDVKYRFDGDEIYVRAKIISTKSKANGARENEVELAWTQAFF